MFNVIICKTKEEVSQNGFNIMKTLIMHKNDAVLGLATVSSPVGMYEKMIEDHKTNGTSYAHAVTYNLDEYIGIPKTDPQSYYTFMHENLFNGLDIPEENIHIPEGNVIDEAQACIDYEDAVKKVCVDIQVLGIGSDGHIAFNEPGTDFASETHLVKLTDMTRRDNARFFDNDVDQVPTMAITQGLATIMRARKIILLASGENKADAVYAMIKGSIDPSCPASVLQQHGDVTVILDEKAAKRL